MASILSSKSIDLQLPDASSESSTRYLSAPNFKYYKSKNVPLVSPSFHSVSDGTFVNACEESNKDLGYSYQKEEKQTITALPIQTPAVLRRLSLNLACPSTMFLHKQDRPSMLPEKDPSEDERHQKQFNKIMVQVKKRQNEEFRRLLAERENKEVTEKRTKDLLQLWRFTILPNWVSFHQSSRVYDIWWHGLPSAIRSQVWNLVIGNKLGITKELFNKCLARSRQTILQMDQERIKSDHAELAYALTRERLSVRRLSRTLSCTNSNSSSLLSRRGLSLHGSPPSFDLSDGWSASKPILSVPPGQFFPLQASLASQNSQAYQYGSLQVIRLDVSRTFPALGLFQSDGPYHKMLHDLLAAFVSFQPSIGYLQGMSFIAAILLLVMDDLHMAFTAFASIMNRPSFHAFYSLDESEFNVYFSAFDRLLAYSLPRLHAHFAACKLDSRLFLFDWLFTIFSRSMPLEANLRVWDLFLRDGESALLLTALGIMQMYEKKLLASDFDQLASFLTGPMPTTMSPAALVNSMRSLGLRKSIILKELDKMRKVEISSLPSPVANGTTVSRSDSISSSSLDSSSSSSKLESCNSLSLSVPLDLEDITDRLAISENDPTQHQKLPQQKNSVWNMLVPCGRRSNSPVSTSNHLPLLTRVMFLTRHPLMDEWSEGVSTDYPIAKDANGSV